MNPYAGRQQRAVASRPVFTAVTAACASRSQEMSLKNLSVWVAGTHQLYYRNI